jgi:pyruvate dehydrogenase E2 component (dihydrolipoamide acetyltransferase)
MNAPLRQFASPYARKLARERGIVLADLSGSGPAGRVVAADVLSFVRPAVAASPLPELTVPGASHRPMPQAAAFVAALAAEIDLGRLQELIRRFADAQLTVSVDGLLLRAAARCLSAIDLKGATGWETGKGETLIIDADNLSLGTLQAMLDGDAAPAGAPVPATLSIRRLKSAGIRAVSMPIRPYHRLRLVLSGDDTGQIDCLLCFDSASIDEDRAVDFLARFKEDIEMPLRLLA